MKIKLAGGIAIALAAGVIALGALALGARSSDGDARAEMTVLESVEPGIAAPFGALAPADFNPEIVRTEADPAGGPDEGVKVHGRWTIDVRDPDGSLVSHREFENALEIAGGNSLVDILARQDTVGLWEVQLGGAPQPCNNFISSARCSITEPQHPGNSALPNLFKNLTLTVVGNPNGNVLRLNGTATPTNDSTLNLVATRIGACGPTVATDQCSGSPNTLFTSKTISPLPVLEGQQVQVTVDISFS